MNNLIMGLVLAVAGLGLLYTKSLKEAGALEAQLSTAQTAITKVAEGYSNELNNRDSMLLAEQRLRREAQAGERRAQGEIRRILADDHFDAPLSGDVTHGLCLAVQTFSGLPGTCRMPDDTEGPGDTPGVAPLTCRDITDYTIQLAGRFAEARAMIESRNDRNQK